MRGWTVRNAFCSSRGETVDGIVRFPGLSRFFRVRFNPARILSPTGWRAYGRGGKVELTPWHPDVPPRHLFNRFFDDPWRVVSTCAGNGVPAVAVFEHGAEVVVHTEVAGVDPKDMDVRLTDDTGTIRSERRPDQRTAPGDQDGYSHSERQYGSFAHTVSLPAAVDTGRAKAEFRNGRQADDSRGHKRTIDIQ